METDPEFQALRERASRFGVLPRHICMSADGTLRMASMDYTPFSGRQAAADYIMLNMVTARTAPMMRRSTQATIDGVIRPGTVMLHLPEQEEADVRWGACGMLALGIDHHDLERRLGISLDLSILTDAASHLHRDPLLSSVMQAIWHAGELHGMSSAFVDQGIGLLLLRLGELGGTPPPRRRDRPISGRQLREIEAHVQQRLGDDLSVSDMAGFVGRDVAGFSRAFREATGLAPYQYLTARRMAHAAVLLEQGQSVIATAMAVGYSNPSKFSAAFRRVRGHLPSHRPDEEKPFS